MAKTRTHCQARESVAPLRGLSGRRAGGSSVFIAAGASQKAKGLTAGGWLAQLVVAAAPPPQRGCRRVRRPQDLAFS